MGADGMAWALPGPGGLRKSPEAGEGALTGNLNPLCYSFLPHKVWSASTLCRECWEGKNEGKDRKVDCAQLPWWPVVPSHHHARNDGMTRLAPHHNPPFPFFSGELLLILQYPAQVLPSQRHLPGAPSSNMGVCCPLH